MARDVGTCEEALCVLAPSFERRALASLEEVDVAVAWIDEADLLVRPRIEEAAAHFPAESPLPFLNPRASEDSSCTKSRGCIVSSSPRTPTSTGGQRLRFVANLVQLPNGSMSRRFREVVRPLIYAAA
jgi:hypothetical protein